MSYRNSRLCSGSQGWSTPTPLSRNNSRSRQSHRVSTMGSRGRSASRGRRDSVSDLINRRRSISLDRASSIFGTDTAIAASGREAGRPTRVRRWDGNDRTTSSWDSIRKVSRRSPPADRRQQLGFAADSTAGP